MRRLGLIALAGLALALTSCTSPAKFANGLGHSGLGQGQSCGGQAGLQCGAGLYCAYPPRTCRQDDAFGVCEPKPVACKAVSEPICGCDGKTYASTCEAAQAGVSPLSVGQCPDMKAKRFGIF